MCYTKLQLTLVHEQTRNFAHLWMKAKAAFLFECISTSFLLPPKSSSSSFDRFVTKNCPALLAGMCFVLSTITWHNYVFVNKCLQLLALFTMIWIPWILGIFTVLLGNWWFEQPCQTQTSSHTPLFLAALYHLPARQIPSHPTSHPLVLVGQNPNTLSIISISYSQICSSPVDQFYDLGYSCNTGTVLTLRKAARLGQTHRHSLQNQLFLIHHSLTPSPKLWYSSTGKCLAACLSPQYILYVFVLKYLTFTPYLMKLFA